MFAFADNEKIDQDTALKLATGFGGGIARNGLVCGAFSAAVMVLGLYYGKADMKNKTATPTTYKLVDELKNQFESEKGSVNCREILKGCELKTEAGRKMFDEQKFDEEVCIHCVTSAIGILENILQNKGEIKDELF